MRSAILALTLAGLATALPQNMKRQDPAPAPGPAPASPSASSAPAPSAEDGNAAYPCPEGYELTYIERQQTYPYSFETLVDAQVADWSIAPLWAAPITATGNETGATRERGDGTIMEVLVDTNMTATFIQTVTNLTSGPLTADSLMVSNYSQVLQLYANDTASTDDSEAATVKLFNNICANDPAAVATFYASYYTVALDNIASLLTGGASASASASA